MGIKNTLELIRTRFHELPHSKNGTAQKSLANPFKTAVPFWEQITQEFDWFEPRNGTAVCSRRITYRKDPAHKKTHKRSPHSGGKTKRQIKLYPRQIFLLLASIAVYLEKVNAFSYSYTWYLIIRYDTEVLSLFTPLGLQSRFGDNWGQTTQSISSLSTKRDRTPIWV